MRLMKARSVIDRLSIINKYGLSDKIKLDFSEIRLQMQDVDSDKTYWEKGKRKLEKNAWRYIWQILEATLYETTVVQPITLHL